MLQLPRRGVLAGALGAAALPRFAIAQGDTRPTVTVAVQKISNSNTLDDLREQSNVGTRLSAFFVERLIDLNYQGQLEMMPGLATAWRRIDDKTVELSLRQGVIMHNGDTFTAEDVVASFSPGRMFGTTHPSAQGKTLPLSGAIVTTNRTKDLPQEVPPVGRRLWPALDRVEAVDKYTVRFVNATPDVTMEGRISCRGSGIISQRAFNEAASWLDYARAPVGTGPYKIREFRPDVSLTMDAHDAYWGGRPPIKTLRLVEVPEVSARINGLLTGEYQFAADIPPDQIASIEGHAGFEVQGGTIPNIRMTVFDKNHPTLHDPRVRLAMAHAIDRKTIVDSLWDGRTVVPAGLQWPFYDQMFVQGWTVPEFDLAKSRDLLKQAGYKGDPIPYRLLNNYYTNQVANGQVLVEMWKQAGLNVEIGMKENWTQVLERNPTRAIRDWSNSAPFNDPVSSIVSQHGPNGEQQQYGEWTNAEMNTLSYELETSTDRPRRHAIFARMLQICEREDPAYTVLHQNAVFTGKPKSIRWKAAPSFAMDFRAANWG
ncbi:ABC transporter substrate-binding protein [Acidisphaera sp. L21]|uniref:ABC transporter substrate-binding protein n=1 Tax=Acidisphaera sp. L21 TaxID=1641851 RepID=UPI00131C4834|nr:ABC transporter substrate-binding protein [Acidisphaera sp. L21]